MELIETLEVQGLVRDNFYSHFMQLDPALPDDELLGKVRCLLMGRNAEIMLIQELDRMSAEVQDE